MNEDQAFAHLLANEPDDEGNAPPGVSAQRQAQLRGIWQYCSDCQGRKHARWFSDSKALICDTCKELRATEHRAILRAPSDPLYSQCATYGMSGEEYQALYTAQQGRCAVCRQGSPRALYIDHDHKTGKVRGLLCNKCNTGLGKFNDDIERMEAAIDYLTDPPADGLGIERYGPRK